MGEGVWIALVTGGLGVLGTWLTVRYKDVKNHKPTRPKDRVEGVFDGYERLIKAQDKALALKERQLEQTQQIIDQLQEELNRTRDIVTMQQKEIETGRVNNLALREELKALKQQFSV